MRDGSCERILRLLYNNKKETSKKYVHATAVCVGNWIRDFLIFKLNIQLKNNKLNFFQFHCIGLENQRCTEKERNIKFSTLSTPSQIASDCFDSAHFCTVITINSIGFALFGRCKEIFLLFGCVYFAIWCVIRLQYET